jgi:hypothetical protein
VLLSSFNLHLHLLFPEYSKVLPYPSPQQHPNSEPKEDIRRIRVSFGALFILLSETASPHIPPFHIPFHLTINRARNHSIHIGIYIYNMLTKKIGFYVRNKSN